MPNLATMAAHPPAAAAVGYNTLTFGPQGFNDTTLWRPNTYFGWSAAGQIDYNLDGSVTLHNNNKTGTQSGNMALCTAWPTGGVTPLFSKGHGFGGGAYFECVMRWTPRYVGTLGVTQWPSWWALPIEQNNSVDPMSIHWPGQAGTPGDTVNSYNHSIEWDFMEYDSTLSDRWGTAMHDYHAPPPSKITVNCETNTNPTNPMAPPGSPDFTQFHKFGALWVPATNAPSNGYAQHYFDDVAIGNKVQWVLNQDASGGVPPVVVYPNAGTQAGSILDKLHLFLIVGNQAVDKTGMQMIVREVNVWQKDASKNINL